MPTETMNRDQKETRVDASVVFTKRPFTLCDRVRERLGATGEQMAENRA